MIDKVSFKLFIFSPSLLPFTLIFRFFLSLSPPLHSHPPIFSLSLLPFTLILRFFFVSPCSLSLYPSSFTTVFPSVPPFPFFLYSPPPLSIFPSLLPAFLCHFFVQFEERKRIEKSGGTVRYVLALFPDPTLLGNETSL